MAVAFDPSELENLSKQEQHEKCAEVLSSFKGRLTEWRQLDNSLQGLIARQAYMHVKRWACLNTACDLAYSSWNGFVYHMKRCEAIPVPTTGLETSAVADGVETSETEMDASTTSTPTPGRRPGKKKFRKDSAYNVYLSYQDRLDEWRKLTDQDQNQLLRLLYSQRKSLPCLTTGCDISLGTYNGMRYHLSRCGVVWQQRKTNCTICGMEMSNQELLMHKLTHGVELGAQEPGTGTQTDGDLKRKKPGLFSKLSFQQYRTIMTQNYLDFKAEEFFANGEKIPLFKYRTDWRVHDTSKSSDGSLALKHSADSMRFRISNEKRPLTLRRFETLQTDAGFISNCGSAVIALAWCPTDDQTAPQYLLVATTKNVSVNINDKRSSSNLQLWRLNSDQKSFQYCYTVEYDVGIIMDIKWCPSGAYNINTNCTLIDGRETSIIGAVALSTAIGDVYISLLPEPVTDVDAMRVYRPLPTLVLATGVDSLIYSIDWTPYKGHDRVVAAVNDGSLVFWKIEQQHSPGNRLLPINAVDVAVGPIRHVRWWSRTKVICSSLDRQIFCWNVEENCFVYRISSQLLTAFESIGAIYPGYAYSADTSTTSLFFVTVADYAGGSSKSSVCACSSNSAVVWAISLNPWTGEMLTVDDHGQVSRSCLNNTDGLLDKRRKLFDTVIFSSSVELRDDTESKDVHNYAEAMSYCVMHYEIGSKKQSKKKKKEQLSSDRFPIDALFSAAWNCNKPFSRWCCFGGQNGLLHIYLVKDKDSQTV